MEKSIGRTIGSFFLTNVCAFIFHFMAIFLSAFNDSGASLSKTMGIAFFVTIPLLLTYVGVYFKNKKQSWFERKTFIILSIGVLLLYQIVYINIFYAIK